jgi:hypothetical protein
MFGILLGTALGRGGRGVLVTYERGTEAAARQRETAREPLVRVRTAAW